MAKMSAGKLNSEVGCSRRSHRWAMGILLSGVVFFVAVMLMTVLCTFSFVYGSRGIDVGGGCVTLWEARYQVLYSNGWHVGDPEKLIWLPVLVTVPGFRALAIPVWIPLVLVVLTLAIARILCRSARPGHCPNCDYNLTGLTSGVCPECGLPIKCHR